MSTPQRSVIEIPPGYKSQEVASCLAQMDDQLRLLTQTTRDITPEELEWQPKPGMNTIGMLLAHNAIVEAFWTLVALKREAKPLAEPVLGINMDDDGMPIPEDGRPPASLKGKNIAYYDELFRKARAFLKESAKGVSDSDLDGEVVRTRDDGTQRVINIRWYFYHILEHFSGHYGQVLLLRHLYKAAHVPAKT
ncbi:MAG TPA: DUF664 domain-containing protein [Candidatus Dormibacteraeota bacterium]|nr:DUF664 domain-containing protein [Candidatus Dormibacteraeota bacterium]